MTTTGQTVRSFYNTTPFPDYELERFNSKEDVELSMSPFAKALDRSIPENASVIDVGTGTGKLAAFLSMRRKCVWGIDFSDSSLDKARRLKEKLKLDTFHIKNIDILDDRQIEGIGMKFDCVLCLGVLHHTGHAYQGFQNVLRLLKPDGYISIGLYNTYGRLPLKFRRLLVNTIFKKNDRIKDWFIRMQIGDIDDKEAIRGWWNDQYLHPHETSHTVGEVLRWFRKNSIKYYQTVPSMVPFDQTDLEISGVWNNEPCPNFLVRAYKQFSWIWKRHHEGGYFLMSGKKV